MNKTAVRVVILLLVGGALALGVLYLQSQRREELGRSLLREFKDDLARMKLDQPTMDYLDGLADQFHSGAYEHSFGPDAPALGGTTDVTAYQKSLLAAMIAQAAHDGRKDLVSALEDFRTTGSTLDLGAENQGGGG